MISISCDYILSSHRNVECQHDIEVEWIQTVKGASISNFTTSSHCRVYLTSFIIHILFKEFVTYKLSQVYFVLVIFAIQAAVLY